MKEIPGFEGKYAVLEDGRVIKFVTQSRLNNGYMKVALSTGARPTQKGVLVHRLLAEAFLPNPLNLPCVNHKNGIKADNRLANLEWCSFSQNIQHAIKHGLIKVGEGNYGAKLTAQNVLDIRERYSFRGTDNLYTLAKEYGVHPSTIDQVVKRMNWAHI